MVTGEALENLICDVRGYEKRDCFGRLDKYIHNTRGGKVYILYGLRRTGKTTLLFQAMAVMSMEDFIDSAALLSDIYAMMGMRIVLSGMDSLGFWIARDNELYDREWMSHTTFIPYREYSRLLGIDSIDEYIRYGGTLRAGELAFGDEDALASDAVFRDDENTRRYIDTAIAQNIQHSLECYEYGSHFHHLYPLYEKGELTGAINRIIEDWKKDYDRKEKILISLVPYATIS